MTLETQTGEVVSVNISEETGTIKKPVPEIRLNETGVEGDAHAGNWHRQASVLSIEQIDRFSAEHGRTIRPGEFAENITTKGIDLGQVAVFDRIVLGDAELEVTQIGKECHGGECAVFREVGACVMPKEGIFARVLRGGVVRPGDVVEFRPRPLRVKVVTMSDRASRGEYEDRSGPAVVEALRDFLQDKRWHLQTETLVLPDEADHLRRELMSVRDDLIDIFITTGGTGAGPRDVTPDVACEFIDRPIPGIMEYIRTKYGADKPNALLSRSVAGIMDNTLIYTLPGSVKAVKEYMQEILKTLEHLLLMIHCVDAH